MSMSNSNPFESEENVLAEINMTPLVDVLLVLLIIFMVTLPVMQQAVKLDLPSAANTRSPAPAPHIDVSLQANGQLWWGRDVIDLAALPGRFTQVLQQNAQTELHLHADQAVPYGQVATLISLAQHAGIQRIGFVTQAIPH